MREQQTDQRTDEPTVPPTVIEMVTRVNAADARVIRWSIGFAVLFHLALFVTQWPEIAEPRTFAKQERLIVCKLDPFKFVPPKQQQLQRIIKPRTRVVPIPDPTPDEPEPLREHPAVKEGQFDIDEGWVAIDPDVPPPPEEKGPHRYKYGGEVTKPLQLFAPPPVYPEAARIAHIEGTVVLECTIDKGGHVTNIKVMRGRPLGLTEAAIDAVTNWRFEPSTFHEKPVEVIYVLSVVFQLNQG